VLTFAQYVATTGLVASYWMVLALTTPGDPLRIGTTVALAVLSGWRFSRLLRP
jgi:hypothetical protein